MIKNFSISEFVIDGATVPLDVADKILKHHINIIQRIRTAMGVPISVSDRSGYRDEDWEKAHGRSGRSEHCFDDKGAADYTCHPARLEELSQWLCESDYMRVCLYDTFIHCDHKGDDKRAFKCEQGQWVGTDI